MKKNIKVFIILFLVVFCLTNNVSKVFAQDNRTQDTVTTQQVIDKEAFEGYFDQAQDKEGAKDNIALYWHASFKQGFDNNVYLDPSRRKDAFLQASIGEYMTYYHSDDQRVNFDSNITSLLYYNQNNNNLMDIYLNPWVEQDIFDNLFTIEAGYVFDWVCFPNSPDGTYINNGFSVYLRNNVTADFYHKIGGIIDLKSYIHDRTYDGSQNKTDTKRFDVVYAGEYQAAWYLWDTIKLKQRVRVFQNESNYKYENYYDYWGYDLKTTGIFYFTQKFYSIMNFSYTKKIFYQRTVPDSTSNQRDNLYVASFLLAYDITPSFTISADYSYRQNVTNQPIDKYSGSIYTIAVNYAF
ncbi:MAG: hypothetical protein PHQ52_05555 [Candidatus Omnitrophica bacterium]|nr:hypothetical protein [Candidatus Omnitrophota bacterium]